MQDIVCIEGLTIDLTRHRVGRDGQDVRLGKKERALLELLVRNANQTLTHQHLLAEVWGGAMATRASTCCMYSSSG